MFILDKQGTWNAWWLKYYDDANLKQKVNLANNTQRNKNYLNWRNVIDMNKIPSIILRIIIILSSVAGVLVSVFALPVFWTALAKNLPEYAFLQYPLILGLYAAGICFFFALFQFWLLLNGVDRDGILSAKRLKAIRLSAIVFSVLYAICAMPIAFLVADADDAPGLILIAAFLDSVPIGVAAVASILERSTSK